ncbi:MAG: hypothetical protein P9X24_05795 [Candidatus Hatepunaea meridiana]|nr:hypothetical protein [Candidatus Hatepunaea meridiana]
MFVFIMNVLAIEGNAGITTYTAEELERITYEAKRKRTQLISFR